MYFASEVEHVVKVYTFSFNHSGGERFTDFGEKSCSNPTLHRHDF